MDIEMSYIKLKLQSLSPGMILHQDAYDDKGKQRIMKGVPITASLLKALAAEAVETIIYKTEPVKEVSEVKEVRDFNFKKDVTSKTVQVNTLDKAMNILSDYEAQIRKGLKGDLPKAVLDNLVDELVYDLRRYDGCFLNLLEAASYDEYNKTHAINVACLSLQMGLALKLGQDKLKELGVASLLHDFGKMVLPEELMVKQGKLNEQDWITIKSHTIHGYNMVFNNPDLSLPTKKGILCHHEAYNGSGYPFGLNYGKLEVISQIITIADVFDAFTTEKPYKKAQPIDEAFLYIMGLSGRKFNPHISQIFLRSIARKIYDGPIYPIHSFLVLNTGEIGYVVDYRLSPFTLKPIVNIFYDPQRAGEIEQRFLKCHQQIDLEINPNRHVVKKITDPGHIQRLNQIVFNKMMS